MKASTHERIRVAMRLFLAAVMAFAGISHFTNPTPIVQIVPDYLPAPLLLVQISGVFEILGAVGLLVPRLRSFSGWGLVALYIAVFPANLYAAMHHSNAFGDMPAWVPWARLPLQLVLIAWAYWVSRESSK